MSTMTSIAGMITLIVGLIVLAGCHPIYPSKFQAISKIRIQAIDPNHEGRYVVAQDGDDNWSLRQEPEVIDDCGLFALYDLGKDKMGNRIVALGTCHDRFVTVPRGDTTRPDKRPETRRDRMAWQELRPGDCAQFTLEPLDDGTFAFKTCGGSYLTAGDAGTGWERPLEWAIIVESPIVEGWEKFKLSPPPK